MGVAPLLLALRLSGPYGALGLAYLWHAVYSFVIGDWLVGGIAFYFELPGAVALLCFVLMTSLMVAPYYLLFAAVYRALARRYRRALPWLAAAAWVATELARGLLIVGTPFFVGNPWALLGYSQSGVLPLVQIVSVTGIYGLSFALMVVNAALAEQVLAWHEGRWARGPALRGLTLAALPTLLVLVFGLASLREARDPAPDAARVAVVQGHIGLAERWHRYFHGRNLATYLRLSDEELRRSGADTLFWPEAAMTFFYPSEPGHRRAIASLLQAHDAELVSGIPHDGPGDDDYFNSVYLIAPDGTVKARYDKEYLMPFAEYLPFGRLGVTRRWFGRFREFDHSGPPRLLPTRAGKAGVLVCNEALLPEAARQRVLAGAEYLTNPSNDSWSRDPKYTRQWFDIISLRAVEQRRYLVRASTSGPSAVVDPWGRVLTRTDTYTRGAASGAIERLTQLSIYGRVGDLFGWLCAAGVSAAILLRRAPRAPA